MPSYFDENVLILAEEFLSSIGEGQVCISKEFYNEGIAIITISNPHKKNAISGKMMVQLRKCVLELEQWGEGKAVIVRGENGNFCSGGDLDFAQNYGTKEAALYMSSLMMDTLLRLSNLDLISVCLIEGPTIGGGAEISAFCDYIVAADNVTYGFVHGKIGITPAWGGGSKLIEKIGHRKALTLLLTSELLSAVQCIEISLADQVVPAHNCLFEALEWTKIRIKHHFSVTRSIKKLIKTSRMSSLLECLQQEKELTSKLWGAEENRKMLAKSIKHRKIQG